MSVPLLVTMHFEHREGDAPKQVHGTLKAQQVGTLGIGALSWMSTARAFDGWDRL
jgi:hypothetical protein